MAFLVKDSKPTQRSAAGFSPVLEQWVKVSRAADSLPATTTEAIFRVNGGRVLVKALIGEVTTAIQAQACNLKVSLDPDTGTTADVASNLDINAKEAGTLLFPEGDGTALIGANAGTGFSTAGFIPFVAPVGEIEIVTSATNTGAIKWDCYYLPLDPGSEVVATAL